MPLPPRPRPDIEAPASAGQTWSFDAIGTPWLVDADVTPGDRDRVVRAIDEFDRAWSRFRPDSAVVRVARTGGTLALDDATDRLFDLYDVLWDLTDGAVNPLVGDSLAALGYDASYSLAPGAPRSAVEWGAVDRTPGRLTLPEPALVDIGAAGKGLAVDLVAGLLSDMRLRTIDASGDLWHADHGRELRVALEDPDDPRMAIGVVDLAPTTAIAASASNRRAWGDGFHHVLDARTGLPTRNVVATWAIADSAAVADGAATALFFAEPDAVVDRLALQAAVVLTSQRQVLVAGELPGRVFT